MKKLLVILAFAMIGGMGVSMAQSKNITLEDIWTKGTFRAKGIGAIRSMADGEHYCTMSRTGITRTTIAALKSHGCLDGLQETNQFTLF